MNFEPTMLDDIDTTGHCTTECLDSNFSFKCVCEIICSDRCHKNYEVLCFPFFNLRQVVYRCIYCKPTYLCVR